MAVVLLIPIAGCGGSSGSGHGTKPVDPNGPEVSPAGDIPDNQAFVAYAPPRGGYSVKVPEGWGRTGKGSFTDKLNSVQIQAVPAKSALTVAAAKHQDVPALAKSLKGFQAAKVSTVRRGAGAAVRITYLADSKPDAVTGKVGKQAVERYVFFRKGKRVILTLSGAKGADNVDPWKIVSNSVRFTP